MTESVEASAIDSGTEETGETQAEGLAAQPSGDSKSTAEKAGIDPKNPSSVLKSKGKAEPEKAEEPTEDDLSEEYLDKKVTVTIDGEKHRMTVREAIKLQQLEKVSKSKMNEAAKVQRQVQTLLKQIEDPREYFKLRGIDPTEFAEMTLKEQLQYLEETPEQRELRELKQYREMTEKERAEAQRQAQEAEQARLEREHQTRFNTEFVEAWKETGLPADRLFGQWMAAEMVSANARGDELSASQAAVIVKDKAEKLVSSILQALDPEGIRKRLGPEKEKALREYWVTKVSSGNVPSPNSGPRPADNKSVSQRPEKKSGKYMDEKQWHEWIKS